MDYLAEIEAVASTCFDLANKFFLLGDDTSKQRADDAGVRLTAVLRELRGQEGNK